MAADSVVGYLLVKLDSLLIKETRLLRGVKRGVDEMKGELEVIRSFLKDASEVELTEERMRSWVNQVRELAYDIEDIIDEFVLRIPQPSSSSGPLAFLTKSSDFIMSIKARHQIANKIRRIKAQMQALSQRRKAYCKYLIISNGSTNHHQVQTPSLLTQYDPRVASFFLKEDDIVGVQKPKMELVRWALDDHQPELDVFSVVGMGGIGKTALVKLVYESPSLETYFHCRAWVMVSISYKTEDILRSLIAQFSGESGEQIPAQRDSTNDVDLINIVRELLHDNRYVVVLDDLWDISSWQVIKHALPDSNTGSRIIITTRNNDVATTCVRNPRHVHSLQPLSYEDSWVLFCRGAFINHNNNNSSNKSELNSSSECLSLLRSIVSKCGGLPLAIVAVSGVLAAKKSMPLTEVGRFHDTLSAQLHFNSSLNSVMRILSLSYTYLPPCLKSCLLYFSIFPKSFTVKVGRLIRLWISEGFIEPIDGMALEETGESYLNELVSRNLVQITGKLDVERRVKKCQIHDLVHEMLSSVSKEENFCKPFPDYHSRVTSSRRIRRSWIHGSSITSTAGIAPSNTQKMRHLRSFFTFEINRSLELIEGKRTIFSTFRLLKVLDLKRAPMQTFPIEIIQLIHLRYLSLRRTSIKKLPKSIGRLKNLEFLDLKYTDVSELPDEITCLQNLRHVHVFRYQNINGVYNPFTSVQGAILPKASIAKLKSLQSMSYVEAIHGRETFRELAKLSQLKKISIVNFREEDSGPLCASIKEMRALKTLYIATAGAEEVLNLHHLSSVPRAMQHVYLKGALRKLPTWVSSHQNLTKLLLGWSRLTTDPLRSLQSLSNLLVLYLYQCYDGDEMVCETGGFPRLKSLEISMMEKLTWVRLEVGALPSLEEIELRGCGLLKNLPDGIQHLDSLKELTLADLHGELVDRVHGEDRQKVMHIPLIRHYFWRQGARQYQNLSTID